MVHLNLVDFLDTKLDPGQTRWTRRTGDRLDRRLSEYSRLIQGTIRDHASLQDSGDLSAAIKKITTPQKAEALIGGSNFEPLREWVEGLHGELRVPEHNDQELSRFFSREGAPSDDAMVAYRLVSRAGSLPPENQPPKAVYDYVANFRQKPGKALSGDDLAKRYFSAKDPLPEPSDDPDDAGRGIYLEFSRALASSFNDAVIMQLRADYLQELSERAIDEDPQQLKEFWYDPAVATERPFNHEDAVGYFFDDDGKYLRLLQRYEIPGHADRDFRVGAVALAADTTAEGMTGREANLWRLDHFLQQMLLYVRGAERITDLSADQLPEHPLGPLEDFEMSLNVVADYDEFDLTWKKWNSFKSPLFTDERGPTSIQDPRSGGDIIETNAKRGWGFEKRRQFVLAWRDGTGADWVSYEDPSSLVPLQLFWSDRKSWSTDRSPAKQQPSALVNFEVKEGSQTPFELTIDPVPPRRPNLDLEELSNK